MTTEELIAGQFAFAEHAVDKVITAVREKRLSRENVMVNALQAMRHGEDQPTAFCFAVMVDRLARAELVRAE
jgi:hypothetical protein